MVSLLVVLPLAAVLWKALDTCQRLAVLAAASTPTERREAFTAAVPSPPPSLQRKATDEPGTGHQPLVGLTSEM